MIYIIISGGPLPVAARRRVQHNLKEVFQSPMCRGADSPNSKLLTCY